MTLALWIVTVENLGALFDLGLMTLALWIVAVENLAALFDADSESARSPVGAYPGSVRFLLVYLEPIAWITTVLPSVLTGGTPRQRLSSRPVWPFCSSS